jgi:hypothetical protein
VARAGRLAPLGECPRARQLRLTASSDGDLTIPLFDHEPFEDYLDYVPAVQLALADVLRDATAVIDALGWDPDTDQRRDSVRVLNRVFDACSDVITT